MSQTPKPDSMRKLTGDPPRQSEKRSERSSSKVGMYNAGLSRKDTQRSKAHHPPRRENRSVVSGTNKSDLSNLVAVGADKKKQE